MASEIGKEVLLKRKTHLPIGVAKCKPRIHARTLSRFDGKIARLEHHGDHVKVGKVEFVEAAFSDNDLFERLGQQLFFRYFTKKVGVPVSNQ